MKKTKNLLLLIAFILPITLILTACSLPAMEENATNKEEEKSETETIKLTPENFEMYFNVNTYTSNYYESSTKSIFGGYDYDCSCNLNIDISKTSDFEIKDVKVTFKIISSWDYIQNSYTEDYQEYIDITLPQSGNINKVYKCTHETYWSSASQTPSAYFEDVSGFIIIEK